MWGGLIGASLWGRWVVCSGEGGGMMTHGCLGEENINVIRSIRSSRGANSRFR